VRVFVFGVLVAAFALGAHAEGDLDPAFGFGGRSDVPFDVTEGTLFEAAFASALQSDGRLVLAGAASNAAGNLDFAATRLLPNGFVDDEFGSGGRLRVHFDLYSSGRTDNDRANGVALQPGGKIVLAGTADGSPFPELGGATSLALARFDSGGALDPGFGADGTGKVAVDSATGRAVAILPNNMIAVAGASGAIPALFVFDADGKTINTAAFDLVPDSTTGEASALGVDPLGRIVVAGSYFDDVGQPPSNGYDCFVARYAYSAASASYVRDDSFGGNGRFRFGFDVGYGYNDHCNGLAVQPDGNVVVVGSAESGASSSLIGIARVLSDGSSIDPAFNGGKFTTYFEAPGQANVANAVKLQSDGKIVIAGIGGVSDPARAPNDFGILRLERNGNFDDSLVASTPGSNEATAMVGFEAYFGKAAGENDPGLALSIDSADRIYAVGAAQYDGSDYDMAVARLDSLKIFVGNFERAPQ